MPLIAWIATALASQVTPYPLPVSDTASSVYAVSVNGTNVPVSNSRDASYAHFAFSGTARVVVTLSQAVASYRLSPASAGLAPTVRGSSIEWTMTRPRKLILHHVNGLAEKLCILADPPEEDPPRPGDPGVVVLGGVDAAGATDVSAGLQAALDGVPVGGTLCIPAGRYGFTTLQMRTGRNVYLAPGAALVASGTGAPRGRPGTSGGGLRGTSRDAVASERAPGGASPGRRHPGPLDSRVGPRVSWPENPGLAPGAHFGGSNSRRLSSRAAACRARSGRRAA